MIILLVSWIILAMVFWSFGDLTVKFWNILTRRKEEYSVSSTFYIGIATIGTLACSLSLIIPLSRIVTICFIAVAVAFSLFHIKWITLLVKNYVKLLFTSSLLFCLFVFVAIFIIVVYSFIQPDSYDMYLYHLQSMAWTEQFHVVPGLGNLHGRFAFNSNSLLLYTLFFYHPSSFSPNFTINGLILFVFIYSTLKQVLSKHNIFLVLILLLIGIYILSFFMRYISGTSTDFLVNILVFVLLFSFMTKQTNSGQYLFYIFIPLFCITLKLSSFPILLIALPLLINIVRSKNYKVLIVIMFLAVVVLIPWLMRFIVMSGYLVYPFSSIDIFDVDWKIPINDVIAEENSISSWAKSKTVGENLQLSIWFPFWINNLEKNAVILYILAIISPLFLILIHKKQNWKLSFLIPWGTAFVGFIIMFMIAPDPRFSISFILCTAFFPFIYLSDNILSFLHNRKLFMYILFITIFGFIIYNYYYSITTTLRYTLPYQNLSFAKLIFTLPDIKRNHNIIARLEVNGIVIYYPVKSDQCFDCTIPCTPYYNEYLELRGEGLQQGFRDKQQKKN